MMDVETKSIIAFDHHIYVSLTHTNPNNHISKFIYKNKKHEFKTKSQLSKQVFGYFTSLIHRTQCFKSHKNMTKK